MSRRARAFFGFGEREGALYFGDEIGEAVDGAGGDDGEKAGGGEVGEEVAGGLAVAAIDIDGVAELLEAVVGEAEGEEPGEAVAETLGRDHEADVEQEAAAEEEATHGFGLAGADAEAEEEIERGGDGHEQQAAGAEFGQEEHAGDDEDGETPRTRPADRPVEQADRDQEDEVRCGGWVHGRPERALAGRKQPH